MSNITHILLLFTTCWNSNAEFAYTQSNFTLRLLNETMSFLRTSGWSLIRHFQRTWKSLNWIPEQEDLTVSYDKSAIVAWVGHSLQTENAN